MTTHFHTSRSKLRRAYGDIHTIALLPTEQEALAFLLPLSPDYPGIDLWFLSKVVPGLRLGTRTLLRVERGGCLIGVGIGKRESSERKICTVRIAPSHFGRGIGLKLFDGLLRWLDVDQPHLTVSERKLPVFERIFERYGFALTSVQPGRYIPHIAEWAYNEPTTGIRQTVDANASRAIMHRLIRPTQNRR